jgi:hypothetical protein
MPGHNDSFAALSEAKRYEMQLDSLFISEVEKSFIYSQTICEVW